MKKCNVFREISYDVKEDFCHLLDLMIDELIKEDDLSVEMAIVLLSKKYNVSISDIKSCLKSIDSMFTANNNVIYWDDKKKKYIKRTSLLAKIGNIYTKIGTRLKNIDPDMDPDIIFQTIEMEYTQNF